MVVDTNKADNKSVEARRRFAVAWNQTMIKIWKERIQKLGIIDTGTLFHSPLPSAINADADFYSITEEEQFVEYGIWVDAGVGRGVEHGNPGDLGHENRRQRRKWFSTKYYGSVMALKDFMADSLGEQFVGMVANALDTDKAKRSTSYYKRKGWS